MTAIDDVEEAARAVLATLELRAAELEWLMLFDDQIPRPPGFEEYALRFWNAGISLHWFLLAHLPLLDEVDPDVSPGSRGELES